MDKMANMVGVPALPAAIPTENNPMCSCGHRQSQHTVSGSQSCIVGTVESLSYRHGQPCCPCSCFDADIDKPGEFQPANHMGHLDTCRNCGKAESFHIGGKCRESALFSDQDAVVLAVLGALRNSQTTVGVHVGHRAINALAVFVLTPHIRHYLQDKDPQALRQAVEAIKGVTNV